MFLYSSLREKANLLDCSEKRYIRKIIASRSDLGMTALGGWASGLQSGADGVCCGRDFGPRVDRHDKIDVTLEKIAREILAGPRKFFEQPNLRGQAESFNSNNLPAKRLPTG